MVLQLAPVPSEAHISSRSFAFPAPCVNQNAPLLLSEQPGLVTATPLAGNVLPGLIRKLPFTSKVAFGVVVLTPIVAVPLIDSDPILSLSTLELVLVAEAVSN